LEGIDVQEQFKALVQAAHLLGIRIVLDFIPRTAARDSDLIKEHPDWFYWIKIEELASYKPPYVPELPFKIPDPSDWISYIQTKKSNDILPNSRYLQTK